MSKTTKKSEDKSASTDALLECLVFITAHYGRAKSAQALVSGLAYDGKRMRPELFGEAAERLGIRTKTAKKARISDIPDAVLPAVLILNGERACVLVSATKIYDPATQSKTPFDAEELQKDYTGYVILTQSKPEFTNPDVADPDDRNRLRRSADVTSLAV